MKGKQTALMPGTEDKVGYWLTQPDLMARLQAEFDFDFDAAPYPRPAGFDGLKEPWGKRTWVNPPFRARDGKGIDAWARKAIEERDSGKTVVFIGPVYRWIGRLIAAGAEIRYTPVAWNAPTGLARRGGAVPTCIFILRPKP